MYYIKVRLRASECYVEGCSAIDMCICKRKEDINVNIKMYIFDHLRMYKVAYSSSS